MGTNFRKILRWLVVNPSAASWYWTWRPHQYIKDFVWPFLYRHYFRDEIKCDFCLVFNRFRIFYGRLPIWRSRNYFLPRRFSRKLWGEKNQLRVFWWENSFFKELVLAYFFTFKDLNEFLFELKYNRRFRNLKFTIIEISFIGNSL